MGKCCIPTYKDLFYLIALSVLGFFALEGHIPCDDRPYLYPYGVKSLEIPSSIIFDISDEHNPVNQLVPQVSSSRRELLAVDTLEDDETTNEDVTELTPERSNEDYSSETPGAEFEVSDNEQMDSISSDESMQEATDIEEEGSVSVETDIAQLDSNAAESMEEDNSETVSLDSDRQERTKDDTPLGEPEKTVAEMLIEGRTINEDYVRNDKTMGDVYSKTEKTEDDQTIEDVDNIEDPEKKIVRYGYAVVTETNEEEFPVTVSLKPQIKRSSKQSFKAVGTNFIALFRAWTHAGWTQRSENAPAASVSLFLTKPITLVPGSHGKMISQISQSSCIGGTKGVQLRCRKEFAQSQDEKCSFNKLGVSPMQYNLWSKSECKRFFKVASARENRKKMWIAKVGGSYHGKNMQVFKGLPPHIKKKHGHCSNDRNKGGGFIMMDYISNPVLLDGHKFDMRTYLLIASTKPFLVFHHDGFIRRSGVMYSNNTHSKAAHITNHKSQDKYPDHFWGFKQLEEHLYNNNGFPKDFISKDFHDYTKHVTNFVFQAARARLKRRSGAFMLFALDWMLDMDKGIHLLEANGNPSVVHYEGTGLTPHIWNDMTELLTNIHKNTELVQNPTVGSGFAHGGWELIFNEAEEDFLANNYNPCKLKEYVKQPWPEKRNVKQAEANPILSQVNGSAKTAFTAVTE